MQSRSVVVFVMHLSVTLSHGYTRTYNPAITSANLVVLKRVTVHRDRFSKCRILLIAFLYVAGPPGLPVRVRLPPPRP